MKYIVCIIYQVPVAGQQAELQRVLCDDEQKEAAVDFGLPGGEVFKDKCKSTSCK